MTVTLVVAAANNDVIGSDGDLPWHLPDDLRNFKRITTGKPIVMGRKTHESIGRALPARQNIIVTRDISYEAEGCDVAASPEEALALANGADEVMVIGGGEIYRVFLPLADRVYLTRVHADVDGDTFFPALDDAEWELVSTESHLADDRHAFAFDVMRYERKAAK